MKIYKVTVTKDEKQYLTVAPLLENKAKTRATSLHEQFPYGTVTVLSTENPDKGWDECWVISPAEREVEIYAEEDEDY